METDFLWLFACTKFSNNEKKIEYFSWFLLFFRHYMQLYMDMLGGQSVCHIVDAVFHINGNSYKY